MSSISILSRAPEKSFANATSPGHSSSILQNHNLYNQNVSTFNISRSMCSGMQDRFHEAVAEFNENL